MWKQVRESLPDRFVPAGARFIVGTDIDAVALSCAKVHADLEGHEVDIQFGREAPITGRAL